MGRGKNERQLEQLQNIARLRRLQGRLAADDDVSAVRASLERELGETVSLRQAARFLGLSHTALSRWIDSGDLTLVENREGRQQVSVSALLDLAERVEQARGRRSLHVLEPTLERGRRRAEEMVLPDPESGVDVDPHERAAEISLAYHRALASRLRKANVAEARHRINRWAADGRLDPRWAEAWQQILNGKLDEIRLAISADSQEAQDLRQNSPFAGMLSEPERQKILARYQ